LIRRLFEREVPEVGERTIELKALAREPGHRTKIAVSSIDSKVDAVGACVGVRGSRIKNIVDELGGEKIDIVRWNESSQILISNALKPAEVAEVSLCFELGRATVVVNDDQLSLAIGKRGQNVRLAARLTGWDIDILTPPEFQAGVKRLDQTLKSIEGIAQEHVDKIVALGLIDVRDIEEVGVGPLMEEVGLEESMAERVVNRCADEAKIVAVEQEKKKAEQAKAHAAKVAAGPTPREAEDMAVLVALGLRGVDAVAGERPAPQPGVIIHEEGEAAGGDGEGTNMPGPFEAAPGGSPETQTHKELSPGDELSPEEEAVQGIEIDPELEARQDQQTEEGDPAALVEGRDQPPKSHRDEPV
jgi:N utilization substance protein A